MKKISIALFVLLFGFLSCAKDDPEDPVTDPDPVQPVSPVVFHIDSVPYTTLSHYNFFSGNLADMQPVTGVIPYAPINALFSDYAHKSRFVWMPSGVKASYLADNVSLDFPNGTVLIKNFYYDHVQPQNARRIMETRLLIRKYGQWVFADYVWNDAQTEATMDLNGSYVPLEWLDDNNVLRSVTYRIPAEAECNTCHINNSVPIPIGPKPQNINSPYIYPEGSKNQLAKWVEVGYLNSGYPANIETVAKWDDPSQSLNDRVRGYVDINCSHCHADDRYCSYRSMRFAWGETLDPAHLGVCVAPDVPLLPQHSHIVKPGNTEKSLLYYRINSGVDGIRMPLLGRTLIHEEGRQLIEDWINSLTQICN